ncbi:MAG: nucleotidyltransferase domain-containing protein [Candidatus Bathyarchaeota archaeon]|nr:nucleotidyltransferase domain-containing protein [Candidatus Bathyarchaeota archaeon]
MRAKVAKEAAALLYHRSAHEYKQAKEKAAQSLGVRILPSNLEVALELDRLADELEGVSRKDLILRLRREALQVMSLLGPFKPRLVGSVWRGTSRRGSDIDILVFSSSPESVLEILQRKYKSIRTKWLTKADGGKANRYFHIYLTLPSKDEIEIVVRSPEDISRKTICEIYGDTVTGLSFLQLKEVLENQLLQKFIPVRKRV